MAAKLLFFIGIVVAHGALAAGLLAQESVEQRQAVVSSCTRLPATPLRISPQRELLAYVVPGDPGPVYQP